MIKIYYNQVKLYNYSNLVVKIINIFKILSFLVIILPFSVNAEIEVKHKYLTTTTNKNKSNNKANILANKLRDLTILVDNVNHNIITVKQGDSFLSLAKKHNLSSAEFAKLNNLKSPYHIKIGQRLKISTSKIYKVKKGDDLEGIAWLYNLSLVHLYEINNFPKYYKVKPGEIIKIHTNSINNNDKLKDTKKIQIKKLKTVWPLKGKVITKYGMGKVGVKSEGINIAANLGDQVKACASGFVVYVNKDGLGGLGNVVIIEHAGEWFSTYAHLGEIIVENGDNVNMGELIAKVGNTGNANIPQLYFALRKEGIMVNPQKYLP
jgi:murein DD-endopeptidase MepM/ murein hydrolase activator NlpD